MLCDEHLHHRPAQLQNVGDFVADLHAVRDWLDTGGGITAASFNADHAHPAGGKGLHAGMVAKIRDVHPGFDSRFQYHLPWLGDYLNPINGDGYVICHGYYSGPFSTQRRGGYYEFPLFIQS